MTSIGKVIFLNGTSSAGKTTLAHALQERLARPWQHMALDQFRDGLPPRYRGLNSPAGTPGQCGLNVVPVRTDRGSFTEVQFGEYGKDMLRGMRRAIAGMARAGNNVIVDDIILAPEFLKDYLYALKEIDVYFVGVRCPLDTIRQREAIRPGRFPGTAESHFDICHAHRAYDVEVNTARLTPGECATLVIKRLEQGPPLAFPRLTAGQPARSA